jgi:hypothetical protein
MNNSGKGKGALKYAALLHLGSTVLHNAKKPFNGSGGLAQTV